jgi:hypothetical protein
MKKAIFIIAALVVFTSFTFAQVSVGAWGRGMFMPVLGGGDDIMAQLMSSWYSHTLRIGVTLSGTSDNVGFQFDLLADPLRTFGADAVLASGDPTGGFNPTVTLGDNQKIWVKPIDMLTITVGNFFDDTLRGNAVFGAWNWLRYGDMKGESALFERVCTNGADYMETNVEVALAPVEGAYIFVSLNGLLGAQVILEDALPLGQYGAGYTIEGIGQIKLQYIGKATSIDEDWGMINAGFKLTMIEGLVAELGAFIPTDSDQNYGITAVVNIYASYTMDALTLHLLGEVQLADEEVVTEDNTFGFAIAAGVDYSLEGGIGINADIRYRDEVISGQQDGTFSGMAGLTMGFSNGVFGLGIEVTTGNFIGGPLGGATVTKSNFDDMVFALPIRLEYWF